MAKIHQLAWLCLFIALLCEFSVGLIWTTRHRQLPRLCSRRFFRVRRRLCRKPVIPGKLITMKPTTASPQRTTSRPVPVYNLPKLHSSGLPFCKDRDINAILNPSGRRTKRATSWPYECRYASILQRSGSYQFIYPIYDCCLKCSFPGFTTCVADSQRKKNFPTWKCPSDGLHCIVGCVNKHDPNQKAKLKPIFPSVVKPGLRPAPDKSTTQIKPVKPVLNNCEKLVTENGQKCVRKLCVTLDFKP